MRFIAATVLRFREAPQVAFGGTRWHLIIRLLQQTPIGSGNVVRCRTFEGSPAVSTCWVLGLPPGDSEGRQYPGTGAVSCVVDGAKRATVCRLPPLPRKTTTYGALLKQPDNQKAAS